MNQSAYNIFVLNNYLRDTFGDHVPYEIIKLIIMSTYPKIKISCGYSHTCLLMDEVYVWGDNDEGQLGLGHNQSQNSPQKFAPMQMNRREEGTSERGKLNLSNIKDIICGGRHTIALTDSNEVWVWGYNNEGQLGLGHYQHQNSPQKGGNLRTGETKFAKY